MNNRKGQINAYIVTGLIATIGIILSFIERIPSEFQDICLDIGTSGYFTIILFCIFNQFAYDEKKTIIEELERIVKDTNGQEPIIEEKRALSLFFEYIGSRDVKKIDMFGYSMAHVFQQHKSNIIQLCNAKTKFRILLLDPDSTAGNVMKEHLSSDRYVDEPHKRSISYIEDVLESTTCKITPIEVKKTSWIPSCTMMIAELSDKSFVMLIGINGFNLKDSKGKRLYRVNKYSMIEEEVTFYIRHFNHIWNSNLSKVVK